LRRSWTVVVSEGWLIAALAGILLISAAGHSAAVRGAAKSEKSLSDETSSFAKIRDEWAKNMHAKKLEPLVMMYTPDGVFLPPTGERIVGRDAIRELCRKVMGVVTSDLHFQSAVVDQSGDLAYDSGEFTETLTQVADGSKSETHGSYLMILKRQADGRWLIAEQMWSGMEPPGVRNTAR